MVRGTGVARGVAGAQARHHQMHSTSPPGLVASWVGGAWRPLCAALPPRCGGVPKDRWAWAKEPPLGSAGRTHFTATVWPPGGRDASDAISPFGNAALGHDAEPNFFLSPPKGPAIRDAA